MGKLAFPILPCALVFLIGCGWGYSPGHDPAHPMKVALSAPRATIPIGDNEQLTTTVMGNGPTGVTYTVNGASGGNSTWGTISATGLYTTPTMLPANPGITITATNTADTTASASVTIQLTGPIINSVTVNCSPNDILNTQAAQCTQNVQGDGGFTSAVNWYVNGVAGGNAALGTVSPLGLYVPPDPIPASSVAISAVSQEDPTKQGTAPLGLFYPPPTLSGVTPGNLLWMGPSATITVSGTNFSHISSINVSGSSVTTNFVSSSQLTANIPSSLLQNQGSGPVQVATAGPGGGTSNTTNLTVVGGSMSLAMSGLPSGATATLQVSGPNAFSQAITSSTTVIGMPAGNYTITAGQGDSSTSHFHQISRPRTLRSSTCSPRMRPLATATVSIKVSKSWMLPVLHLLASFRARPP